MSSFTLYDSGASWTPDTPSAGYASFFYTAGLVKVKKDDGSIITINNLASFVFTNSGSGAQVLKTGTTATFRTITTSGYVTVTQDTDTVNIDVPTDKVSIQVQNKEGATISKGQVVTIGPSGGGVFGVKLAKADTTNNFFAVGVANETFANNAFGEVIFYGLLSDINTSAFTEGLPIYLSPTTFGAFTQTRPVNGLITVIGLVIRSHVSLGQIIVSIEPSQVAASADLLDMDYSSLGDRSIMSFNPFAANPKVPGGFGLFQPSTVYPAVINATTITHSGNITSSGTGLRHLADLSNGTITNRFSFKSSTTNGASSLTVLPNGTSTTAEVVATNAEDPTNAGFASLKATSSAIILSSDRYGSGTYQPLDIYCGGSFRQRITTTGQYLIGYNTPVVFSSNTLTPQIQEHAVGTGAFHSITRWTTPGAGGANILLSSSRGASIGSFGALQSGDGIGGFQFQGDDGSKFLNNCASITAQVDGAVSTDVVPTRMAFNLMTTAGAQFQVLHMNSAGTVTFSSQASTRFTIDGAGAYIRPGTDNSVKCGDASFRWSEVFAGNSTINTSDARKKTAVRPLTDSELGAAKALGKEIGVFKFLASVETKGEAARNHIGMTVQRAIEIMESFGLDPFSYGFICYDEWEYSPAQFATIVDEKTGNVISKQRLQPEIPAGNVYGFRMDQLLAFIAAGFEARLSALENP